MVSAIAGEFHQKTRSLRERANLENEIDTRLRCITGAPEDVMAAIQTRIDFMRADFVERKAANPRAKGEDFERTLRNFRESREPTDPARIRNFYTLQTGLGENLGLREKLQSILGTAASFVLPNPENNNDLFLQRDILTIFNPTRQSRETVTVDAFDMALERLREENPGIPEALMLSINDLYRITDEAAERLKEINREQRQVAGFGQGPG